MTDDLSRGEEAVLRDYLGHFRQTFERQCAGLDAEQLARRAVPPSSMSLLGLLRHLAAVEHSWWRRVMDRRLDLPRMWGKDEHRDADFDGAVADDAVVAEAWEAWRREVAYAEEWQASHPMDRLGQHDEGEIEMREVVVHLIEEYARHCGHADLLRECIDGRTDL
jgi:uncharacterized damage-inducible protein DinB